MPVVKKVIAKSKSYLTDEGLKEELREVYETLMKVSKRLSKIQMDE